MLLVGENSSIFSWRRCWKLWVGRQESSLRLQVQTKIFTEAPALSVVAIPLLEATCQAGISTDIFVSAELGGLSVQKLKLLISRRDRGLRNRQIFPYVLLGCLCRACRPMAPLTLKNLSHAFLTILKIGT